MTTDPPPDGELTRLVRQFRAGDAAALDRLIEHTYERLRRLTSRMLDGFPRLRRWEDTGDVFHQALDRLVPALAAVTPESADHYLRLAALQIRRALLDLARRYYGPHGAAARHDSNRGAAPGGDGTNDPRPAGAADDAPATLAQWTEFHEAIDGLPDDLRAVVELHFYHGMTHAAAGAELGVDARTVKRRWSRALRLLGDKFPGLPTRDGGRA